MRAIFTIWINLYEILELAENVAKVWLSPISGDCVAIEKAILYSHIVIMA